ncbi:hypothetical protein PM082_022043 [Marasmius tenuissimus]|nr:hypothetical protein PM082_022043 [Marasmius tenuissimus]
MALLTQLYSQPLLFQTTGCMIARPWTFRQLKQAASDEIQPRNTESWLFSKGFSLSQSSTLIFIEESSGFVLKKAKEIPNISSVELTGPSSSNCLCSGYIPSLAPSSAGSTESGEREVADFEDFILIKRDGRVSCVEFESNPFCGIRNVVVDHDSE